MGHSEPFLLDSDDEQAMHQLMQEMIQRVAEICDRIEYGTATVEDANYIRAEYGIPYTKGTK